jgi:hypothetical protein
MAMSHSAAERTFPEREKLVELFGQAATTQRRSREQIQRFFNGFELLEPGMVMASLWRPESANDLFVSEPERCTNWAAVGRKP